MPTNSIVYNDWSKGEVGSLGLERAPIGSFHASNMLVYADGMIGPRPGLKDLTPADMPTGKLRMLVESPTPFREGVFVVGETPYYYALFDQTAPVAMTGDPIPGTKNIPARLDTATFLAPVPDSSDGAGDGGVWRIRQIDGDAVKMADVPAAYDLCIYNSQLILISRNNYPRLLGSAPSADGINYDFSDGFFLDVGDNWEAVSINTQENYLTITKRNSIHVMYGVFGENSMTVRQVNSAIAAHKTWHVTKDGQDRLWYIPLFRENLATFTSTQPTQLGQYTGLSPRINEDEELPLKRGIVTLEGQLTASSVIAVQSNEKAVINHNGIMTYHDFEVPVSGMISSLGNHVLLTDGGADDMSANIYGLNLELPRPAFTNDAYVTPGDGSNDPVYTSLELPYYFSPQGDIRVRNVKLDVIKYDTGVPNNIVDVEVRTLNRPNNAGDFTNQTVMWSEAATAATTEGVHDRLVFAMHCAKGEGYAVRVTNLVGMKIKSITVEFETDLNQPRDSNG